MKYEEFAEFYKDQEQGWEYGGFKDVVNPPYPCPDLCAILLLLKLYPDYKGNVVRAAEHDCVWLFPEVSAEEVPLTKDDIIYLLRCGVYFDEYVEGLVMYV